RDILSAVDGQGCARHKGSLIACKERHAFGDFFRLAQPAGWDLCDDTLKDFFGHRLDHLGIDIPRRDAIHRDALFGVLLRKRLCKTDDTGFCRRIVALPHLAFLAVDRGDVDDPAEIAVTHAVNDGLYDVEHAVEIDPDDVAPLLIGHAMQHGVAR